MCVSWLRSIRNIHRYAGDMESSQWDGRWSNLNVRSLPVFSQHSRTNPPIRQDFPAVPQLNDPYSAEDPPVELAQMLYASD